MFSLKNMNSIVEWIKPWFCSKKKHQNGIYIRLNEKLRNALNPHSVFSIENSIHFNPNLSLELEELVPHSYDRKRLTEKWKGLINDQKIIKLFEEYESHSIQNPFFTLKMLMDNIIYDPTMVFYKDLSNELNSLRQSIEQIDVSSLNIEVDDKAYISLLFRHKKIYFFLCIQVIENQYVFHICKYTYL